MRKLSITEIGSHLACPINFPDFPVLGYSTDSRLVRPGDLFFALKGEKADGHNFLHEVKQKGAVAAVVARSYQGKCDLPFLAVNDPLHALQELAHAVLMLSSVRIVGITGSIGKTSTKEFTTTLLSMKYRVAHSPGNSNSQVGIPLSILNHTTGNEEALVLEMGMSHPGNITRLVQIAPPEVAVITHVAHVHACNFESIEEISLAKGEILSHPSTRLGILYRDMPGYAQISQIGNCHKLSFSTTSPLADYGLDPSNPQLIQARIEKQTIEIGPLPIPGKHNQHNLMAAVAVARHFNVSWEEIKEGVTRLSLPEKRLQFVRQKEILFLNDSYNASELSVKAALETLPQPQGNGRKIAVLGSMMELGKFSEACHQRVGEYALDFVEEMYCVGEECLPIQEVWKKAKRPVFWFKTRGELIASLKVSLKKEDVVLLKGSRSKEMWKVLEEI